MAGGDITIDDDRGAEVTDATAAIERLYDDERYVASAVINRLKECLGCDTDAELAWILSTSRQNIWKWRKRNSVPYREAVFLALWANLSLDYLLTGRGPTRFGHTREGGDTLLLQQILVSAIKTHKGDPSLSVKLALKVSAAYEKADAMMTRLVNEEGIELEKARISALAAVEIFDGD